MEWNRRNGIEALVPRQRRRHEIAQRQGQGLNAAVLVEMNQIAQSTFIRSKTICRIETAQPVTAYAAAAFRVQGIGILKRRTATDAEEFSA